MQAKLLHLLRAEGGDADLTDPEGQTLGDGPNLLDLRRAIRGSANGSNPAGSHVPRGHPECRARPCRPVDR